ncbi:MAG: hypothetical protein KC503_18290 [Myxococcales bacterium]|nr:hypothetical protein [Myxococcales bacterium]
MLLELHLRFDARAALRLGDAQSLFALATIGLFGLAPDALLFRQSSLLFGHQRAALGIFLGAALGLDALAFGFLLRRYTVFFDLPKLLQRDEDGVGIAVGHLSASPAPSPDEGEKLVSWLIVIAPRPDSFKHHQSRARGAEHRLSPAPCDHCNTAWPNLSALARSARSRFIAGVSRGFIDIHLHILPGLDDGCVDVEQSVELARGLVELGYDEVHPTPHQKAGSWAPSGDERESAATALRDALEDAGVALRINAPAGENMWDELFLERQVEASFPKYASEKSFLLELHPAQAPPMLEQRLFEFRLAGRLPVLAHVERYLDLTSDFSRVEGLCERAALLVNLAALGGRGGWRVHRRARKLAQAGLIHAATTDAHSPDDLRDAFAGMRWIEKHLGEAALERLLSHNPRRILAGDIP